MIIRPVDARDHAAVRDLLIAAFPGPDEAQLVERLRTDGAAAIELAAREDSRIVGHILFSPLQAPMRALALAPLAVAPDRQSAGIGSALVQAGHDRAREEGWDAVFVLGDPGYYGRFGYDAALAAGFESPYAGPHFMALALGRAALPRHGAVTHAPAFAALG